MTKKSKLALFNISKTFCDSKDTSIEVLKDLTFSVSENEIVSLVGPSGCGKSTLFNIISGISDPSSGKIQIDGVTVEERKGRCGYMFQDSLLFPWRRVIENVMLGFEMKGLPKTEASNKATELLYKFGLSRYAALFPPVLSGGMKQKVALLRTVAFNSSLLLLDEPFGSLDAITRTELHYYLFDIWKKLGLTILFITHDIREAIFLSDRIYVLSNKPARILKCININLQRPRKIFHLTSIESLSVEKSLIRTLKEDAKPKEKL